MGNLPRFMPQPLNRISPAATACPVQWGDSAFEKNPHFAASIVRVIAVWSTIDRNLALLITNFMTTDIELVSAILRDMKREMTNSAIDALAKIRLTPEHHLLFSASLSTTKSSRNRRDEFAHHIWGISDAVQDALVLADPRDLSRELAHILGPVQRGGGSGTLHQPLWDPSKYFVYKEADFKSSLAEAKRAEDIVNKLSQLSRINPPFFHQGRFDSICAELKADPLIGPLLQRKSSQK